MTLLEKLGRGDCPNVQVQIFAAISNDVADTAYQSIRPKEDFCGAHGPSPANGYTISR